MKDVNLCHINYRKVVVFGGGIVPVDAREAPKEREICRRGASDLVRARLSLKYVRCG